MRNALPHLTNSVPPTPKRDWYSITNKAAPVAEVYLFDEIGEWGTTASAFVDELKSITAPEMVVHVNSAGGSIFEGLAIYNALRSHPAKVTTRVESLAASIASVILQAGDHRQIVSHARTMIHNAHGFAIGGSEDMRKLADLLDRESDNIAAIYAERAGDGRKKPHFLKLMADETWLTDKETVSEGLADEVIDPKLNKTTVVEESQVDLEADPTNWTSLFSESFSDSEFDFV